jgi:hypothetical protein
MITLISKTVLSDKSTQHWANPRCAQIYISYSNFIYHLIVHSQEFGLILGELFCSADTYVLLDETLKRNSIYCCMYCNNSGTRSM